jgi:hypothetical protein
MMAELNLPVSWGPLCGIDGMMSGEDAKSITAGPFPHTTQSAHSAATSAGETAVPIISGEWVSGLRWCIGDAEYDWFITDEQQVT